jgi:delta-1-pyrroline-5-carboxylate synthetase
MSLYETMFNQFDITVSQLLVTSSDFASIDRRRNIQHVINQLLSLGIVPLLNENDAVSANQGYETFGRSFSDNDSLAALVAIETSAQLLILLTDVKGVYDRPPTETGAKVIDVFETSTDFVVGDKSKQGRGGMGAKVDAALRAVEGGVQAVIIAAGHDATTIGQIMEGERTGTLFLQHHDLPDSAVTSRSDCAGVSPPMSVGISSTSETGPCSLESLAVGARDGSRQLNSASKHVRNRILFVLAEKLTANCSAILAANDIDMKNAAVAGVTGQLMNRLKLTEAKLSCLVDGIKVLSTAEDPLNKVGLVSN